MRLILLACLAASATHAYSPTTTATGIPLRRTDAAGIQFLIHRSTAPGMLNADGTPIITQGSDPIGGLIAAAAAWTGLPGSTVTFLPLELTSVAADPFDGRNVITFADTIETRSITGSALAVTGLVYYENGEIFDTDILFNPGVTFSTKLTPKIYDLQSVATHEMGHAIGANHSGLLAATMFQGTAAQSNSQIKPSADDIAFAVAFYPALIARELYCEIAGKVVFPSGAGVRGALLVAYDPVTGVTVGGLSSVKDGTYSLKAPRGTYFLYAEPLGNPVAPENLGFLQEQVDTAFQTSFFGGIAAPRLVDATPEKVTAEISVAPGDAPFDLQLIGTGKVEGSGDAYIGPGVTQLTAGEPIDLVLHGPGLTSAGASYEIRSLGPGIAVRADSIRIDRRITIGGLNPLRVTVDVVERTEPAAPAAVNVIVIKDGVAVALSASLLITPTPPKDPVERVIEQVSRVRGATAEPSR